jgi:hypothetical protein
LTLKSVYVFTQNVFPSLVLQQVHCPSACAQVTWLLKAEEHHGIDMTKLSTIWDVGKGQAKIK